MKKWLAAILILILAMAFTSAALAEKQAQGKWGDKTVFSVTYDEKQFAIDTEDLKDSDIEGESYYQFTLYNDACEIACFIEYYDWLTSFSSYLASEKEMQKYIEETAADYKEMLPNTIVKVEEVYPVTVTNGKKTAELPFVILRMEKSKELMFRAELVSHGYCIVFDCGASFSDKKLLTTLKQLLDTFVPISE